MRASGALRALQAAVQLVTDAAVTLRPLHRAGAGPQQAVWYHSGADTRHQQGEHPGQPTDDIGVAAALQQVTPGPEQASLGPDLGPPQGDPGEHQGLGAGPELADLGGHLGPTAERLQAAAEPHEHAQPQPQHGQPRVRKGPPAWYMYKERPPGSLLLDHPGYPGYARTSQPADCELTITMKAYEQRFLEQASATVRDLLLIHVAPRSPSVSPRSPRERGRPELVMALGDAGIPQKLPVYTVLRSPHVDKKARDQFQKKTLKRVVRSPALTLDEARWMIDSINMYEFVGVQVMVKVASRTFVCPPDTAGLDPNNVLASHERQCAEYYEQKETAVPAAAVSEPQAALQSLRAVLRDGLLDLRQALATNAEYKDWFIQHKDAGLLASASAPDLDALAAQLAQVGAGGGAGAGPPLSDPDAAALVAVLDSVLLTLDVRAADAHQQHALLFAAACAAERPEKPEMMYALLKYGLYRKELLQQSQAAQLLAAYREYSAFSRAVLYVLLRVWAARSAQALRQRYALPDNLGHFARAAAKGHPPTAARRLFQS